MNHSEKLRLERMIESMRSVGGVANLVAVSKLQSVIAWLERELADNFTADEVESRLREGVASWPSMKLPTEAAELAAQKAARENTPDPKTMSAAEKLAYANKLKLDEMKAAADESAKAKPSDGRSTDNLSPMARLSLANEMARAGTDAPKSAKPITREQLKKDVNRRLEFANEQAAAKKATR